MCGVVLESTEPRLRNWPPGGGGPVGPQATRLFTVCLSSNLGARNYKINKPKPRSSYPQPGSFHSTFPTVASRWNPEILCQTTSATPLCGSIVAESEGVGLEVARHWLEALP